MATSMSLLALCVCVCVCVCVCRALPGNQISCCAPCVPLQRRDRLVARKAHLNKLRHPIGVLACSRHDAAAAYEPAPAVHLSANFETIKKPKTVSKNGYNKN